MICAEGALLQTMMDSILRRMLDHNKQVREAAASAFASLEEKSEANLVPYYEEYMYILYHCIQTLTECHEGLGQTHPCQHPLIDRYHDHPVSDQSWKLFHLLECFGYVATAYGDRSSTGASRSFTGTCWNQWLP